MESKISQSVMSVGTDFEKSGIKPLPCSENLIIGQI